MFSKRGVASTVGKDWVDPGTFSMRSRRDEFVFQKYKVLL